MQRILDNGFGALAANCLCTKHNSLLSPIDTVGDSEATHRSVE
jgi:hypothetical protein